MPKEDGSGAGSRLGTKLFEMQPRPSSSKSSSLTSSDERIDPMIDPQSTDPMDYPMALFDPVTVNTHEKERKARQTANILNDIYKHVTRFEDIFIEPPYEIDLKATGLTAEPDLTYENIKVLLSLYDWFAAAVFDVEACQLPMSEEEMLSSSNAVSEAMTFMKDRLRKLQTIKNDIQDKCQLMRSFIQSKNEVAEELLKEMGVRKIVHRPPPPKVRSKGQGAAGSGPEAGAPAAVSWRQAAKSVSEALKRAKADGFFEFMETEEKFQIVLTTLEKQEAKLKELLASQKALQASIHSMSSQNMPSDGAAGVERKGDSNKEKEFKALSEYNDRILKLLKQSAEQIKLLIGEESVNDELLKNIETELNNPPKTTETASVHSIKDDHSKHSSVSEKASSEKLKVGETDAGVKTGDIRTASTTSATAKVTTTPEEPKKEKKVTPKNKGQKKVKVLKKK